MITTILLKKIIAVMMVLHSLLVQKQPHPPVSVGATVNEDVAVQTYFAEVNEDNIVTRVIVADQTFINSGAVGNSQNWIQATEENYPGKGFTYRKDLKAFVSPQPFPSWTLNEETLQWEAPFPPPVQNRAEGQPSKPAPIWSEDLQDWVDK